MFNYIKSQIDWDKDLPDRAKMIELYTRVYDGEIYNHLKYYYFQERDYNGSYIPVHKRQPCVRANFCKLVVDTSVSLLFGTDHFPTIVHQDDSVRDTLEDIIKYYRLQEIMISLATVGSVGSACLLIRVYEGILNFEVMNTKFLTPTFSKVCPRKLERLSEKYKVKGDLLLQLGYSASQIKKPHLFYWFEREWDDKSEIYYLPYLCDDKDSRRKVDAKRSTDHNLGFVPALWSKNLPNIKTNCIDGACTFPFTIVDSQIEFEYQLSQLGRALKYAGDPLLVLKLEDDISFMQANASQDENGQPKVVRTAANALVLSPEDEAKLLEISGEGSKAVLEYTRAIREYILECLSGNRSNADKVNAAQSGRAMQAMNQSLIWLADKLRISYGESTFIDLLEMIIDISNLPGKGIQVSTGYVNGIDKSEKISLRWPDWYPETPDDQVQTANALKTLTDAGILSTETGTKVVANQYKIVNIQTERSQIEEDQAKLAAAEAKVTEVKNI